MNNEIRLIGDATGDTYKNSDGREIVVIKIANDAVMTSKEMAKVQCWRASYFQEIKADFL